MKIKNYITELDIPAARIDNCVFLTSVLASVMRVSSTLCCSMNSIHGPVVSPFCSSTTNKDTISVRYRGRLVWSMDTFCSRKRNGQSICQ